MRLKINELPSFYINLDEDVRRKESTEAVLSELGFTDVSRVRAVREAPYQVGLAKSYLKTFDLVPPVLPFVIFEDDIAVLHSDLEVEVPDDVDALYLGVNKLHIEYEDVEGMDHIKLLHSVRSSHAIVYISGKYVYEAAEAAKKTIADHKNMDEHLSEKLTEMKVYALAYPVFYQNDPQKPTSRGVTLTRLV